MTGQSLELFFVDGRPEGLVTAEMFNWTGHVLIAPRTLLATALGRPEADRSGVYVLTGEANGEPRAYVGEAEDVGDRLRDHIRRKDWCDVAVLVTASDNRLNKAHVRYLEARLVSLANASGRAVLDNGTAPIVPSLSEADVAKMEAFLDSLLLVLPALRVDVFEQLSRPVQPFIQDPEHGTTTEVDDGPIFTFKVPKAGVAATAVLRDGQLVVQAGSTARADWTGKSGANSSYYALYQQLRRSGALAPEESVCRFLKDVAFNSPSAAAAVVAGRTANGPASWVHQPTGLSWAEWERRSVSVD